MRYSGLDDVIMEASSIAHFSEVIDWKAVTTMLRMRMQDHPLNELAMEIQDISPEFSKVIHDNFWDLVDNNFWDPVDTEYVSWEDEDVITEGIVKDLRDKIRTGELDQDGIPFRSVILKRF